MFQVSIRFVHVEASGDWIYVHSICNCRRANERIIINERIVYANHTSRVPRKRKTRYMYEVTMRRKTAGRSEQSVSRQTFNHLALDMQLNSFGTTRKPLCGSQPLFFLASPPAYVADCRCSRQSFRGTSNPPPKFPKFPVSTLALNSGSI